MAWQQQSVGMFGQMHMDPQMENVNVNAPMSVEQVRWCAEQAAAHAARQPGNQAAYAEAMAWQQRLQMAMTNPQASAQHVPPAQQGPQSQLFIPSNLPGAPAPGVAAAAPTPPSASFEIHRS